MLRLLCEFPSRARFALASFSRNFKKDERGLSGVVVAVMLILVAILAAILIWGLLDGWINDLWGRIIGNSTSMDPLGGGGGGGGEFIDDF